MYGSVVVFALSGALLACLPAAKTAPQADAKSVRANGAERSSTARPAGKTDSANRKSSATGWSTVDAATSARIDAFAREYADFLSSAKTARAAVAELIHVFTAHGGQPLPTGERQATKGAPQPGALLYFAGADGHTVAFVKVGRKPLSSGVRMIIAALDAPHIQLKQRPIYDRAGLHMFDTVVHGRPDLRLWLSRPLALHIHLARPGAADAGLDLIVGENPDDPVLVIPDLLPHLSGKVQRESIVDSPERMDAVAARNYRGLVDYLAGQGIDAEALDAAESALVPAGAPTFVGVDRALLSGHGHSHRALAYAAVRALASRDGAIPERSAVVIALRSTDRSGGTSGLGFVRTALSKLLAGLWAGPTQPDVLTSRRMYAGSTAWLSTRLSDLSQDEGVALAPRGSDAVPRATRRIIDSLDRGDAPYQLVSKPGWGPGRALGALDIDAVGVAVPTRHPRAPAELLSTLDLHYAFRAARAWLIGTQP